MTETFPPPRRAHTFYSVYECVFILFFYAFFTLYFVYRNAGSPPGLHIFSSEIYADSTHGLPIAGIARNITVPADANVTTPVAEFVSHIV